MAKGRIHSIESMGLLDGPGVRSVVFLQGCSLRCRYCHNPDTWDFSAGEEISAKQLIERLCRFKPYYKNGGGVTFSGGEPLMQSEFLSESLRLCKEAGIHTCIDTAGVGTGEYDEILRYTDLVLFDIKHITAEGYKDITGRDIKESQSFLAALEASKTPVWIRHVVVPSLTDDREHLKKIEQFALKIPNVERIELLPYHLLGVHKYANMGLKYSLEGIPPMDKNITDRLNEEINKKLKEKENEHRR